MTDLDPELQKQLPGNVVPGDPLPGGAGDPNRDDDKGDGNE